QLGGGWLVRLELGWGRLRRWWRCTFRSSYVLRMRRHRQGVCPECKHDIIDARDLKYFRNICGFRFEPQEDPFRWRRLVPIACWCSAEVLLFGGGLIALTVVLGFWSPWAAVLPAVLAPLVVMFFRDPSRSVPTQSGIVVAPADGTVTDVLELQEFDPFG